MATATKPTKKPFRLFGNKSEDLLNLHEAILAGLPYSLLARLLKRFKGSEGALLESLWMSPKSLARLKVRGRLSLLESNRLYRASRIFELAIDLHSGSEADAIGWLTTPVRSFSQETPLQRARTEAGARQVEHLIGRLEHGVFS